MKILIVFNHLAPYKVRLFNENAKYHDLTVLFEQDRTTYREKEFYSENEFNFKALFCKGIKFGFENTLTNGVTKHLKNNKYDLIIMNGYSRLPELLAINYLKNNNIPYGLYINGGIIHKESNFKKKFKTKYISGAKFYMSPDEASNEYLVYYGAERNKIYNYPYATIYERQILKKPLSIEEKNSLKEKLNVPYKNIYVSCGQLIERKNYMALLQIWNNMPSDSHLLIFGTGKQKNELNRYVKDHDLKNVHFMGFKKTDELFEYYHISEAFLFPSKEDIYGHVINEALSQGLPVITNNTINSGLHLIKNQYNGFVVEDFKQSDVLKAINYVKKHGLFNNCVNTAKDNTYEVMVKNHLDIFDEVMK